MMARNGGHHFVVSSSNDLATNIQSIQGAGKCLKTKFNVLVAEDDPVFRRVMEFTLGRGCLVVESVSDGLSALHRLEAGGIDFLVTDQQMPGCTGLELLAQKKNNPVISGIPAILCTAKGFELDTQHLINEFNLIEVMHKPFSPRRLSKVIQTHVQSAQLMGQA